MGAALFDKDFLKKLEYLDLIARRLVFGRQQALRASVKKGPSIEFKDFREYSPGDDPRTVDWSVFARLDELFIKLFRQEEELDLWVLLDASASMDFGEPDKFDYARRVAAALAYIGMSNMDSASVVPFADALQRGHERMRGRGRVFALLDALAALAARGRTDLPAAMHNWVARVRRPSLVVLVSDFYGLTHACRALDRLRFFKHQIYVIQVAAPWELDPPIRGELRLVDRETAATRDLTITDGLLRRYRQAFAGFAEELRRYSMKYAIGYSLARTDVPFDQFLLSVLQRGGIGRMTLLAPAALWFALVGAAVVALYLLRIRRVRQTVPALEFWLQLVGQTQMRSLWQRLKRLLSLLLWLIIVACLVLALGNPVISLGRIRPQSIVVILDNSASMQAREADGRTRLERARDALAELTRGRPVHDEWLLIAAGRAPHVLQPWTRAGREIRATAAGLTPHVGSADLPAAVALAGQLLAEKADPAIVLLSDGAAGQVAALAAQNTQIVPWIVGQTADNLGVTGLYVRAHRAQAAHFAQVVVANGSDREVETRVVFEINGGTESVEPATIAAGGTWEKTVALSAPEGGALHVYVDRADALPADNEAFAILEPLRPARVLLVGEAKRAFFFEQALSAMSPLVDLDASRSLSIEEYDAAMSAAAPAVPATAAASAPAADPRSADLTIFNHGRPARLPAAGAFVFVGDWPEELGPRAVGELDGVELTLTDRSHALTRYLTLNAARLARAREVDLAGRATVLARSQGGNPLIFLVQQPDRASLCLAFDVLDSDLPFRNAFPILLRNAVTHLVAEQAARVPAQVAVGAPIEPLRTLPATLAEVRVARVRGRELRDAPLAVQSGSFVFEDTAECGPLRFTIGEDSAYCAVNLTDERETRLAPAPFDARPAERLGLSGRLLGASPWLALAGAALLLVGLEWLTYHFRWTE